MTRYLAALLATAALFGAAAAEASTTPLTIAKRAAIAKAKAVTGASSARLKGMTLVSSKPKRWDAGASANNCDVFMRVTYNARTRRASAVVTGKHCFVAPAPGAADGTQY